MHVNINLLYKQLDNVMNSREEFVEHIRTHEDSTVRAFTNEETSEGIIRCTLVHYLDDETDLTNLQKSVVEIYLHEQYGFDLRANYTRHVKVHLMQPIPTMEDD